MAIATGQFKRIAEAVTVGAAELLRAPVLVTDDRGIVIAASEPAQVGFPFDLTPSSHECSGEPLRVPLRLPGQTGEVIVTERDTGESISPRLAQGIVELMIAQTALVERLPNQREIKHKLIADLLHGSIGDEAAALREARMLGMDLVPPRAVILIDAAEYITYGDRPDRRAATDAEIRRRAQLLIGSIVGFFRLPNDTICAYIGEGEVAVLKASNTKNLESWVAREDEREVTSSSWANLTALKRASEALLARLRGDIGAPISIGVGRYHPGLPGLAASYQDARAALSLGRRFHGQNQVHCLDRLGIAAFVGVSDERTKIDLATHLLSPLDHETDLLETLKVFFDVDCCPSAAAAQLAIHRNTLAYRLDKITSLTGLNPRRFDDAVQIRLALVVRSLDSEVR